MPKIVRRFRKAAKYRPESGTVWVERQTARDHPERLYGMARLRRESAPAPQRLFMQNFFAWCCGGAVDELFRDDDLGPVA